MALKASTPIMVPYCPPIPPVSSVPPITVAEIAWLKKLSPAVGDPVAVTATLYKPHIAAKIPDAAYAK